MDSMECDVCFHEYNEKERLPRTLSCGHSLCHVCVTVTIANGQLTCPFCRVVHKVNAAADVPVSFALVKMVRILTENDNKKTKSNEERERSHPTQAVLEPELHAGVCAEHGSYKFFWCVRCSTWLCRDCTVIEHPASSCTVIPIKQAIIKVKQDEDELVKDAEKSRNSHINYLNNYSLILSNTLGKVEKQIESFQKKIEEQERIKSILQKESKRIVISLSDGQTVREKIVESIKILSKAETVEHITSSRLQSQCHRKSLDSWIKASQSDLAKSATIRNSKELNAHFPLLTKAAEIISKCSIVATRSPLLDSVEQISAERLDITDLRALMELASVWVIQRDGTRAAQVTVESNRLLIHAFRKLTPFNHPACIIALPYENILSLMRNSRTVFMDIEIAGQYQGSIQIMIEDKSSSQTNSFFLRCAGLNDNSFLNTNMIQVLDKNSANQRDRLCGGSVCSTGIVSEPKGSTTLKPFNGLVTLAELDSQTCFCIWYKDPGAKSQHHQAIELLGVYYRDAQTKGGRRMTKEFPLTSYLEESFVKLGVIKKGIDIIEAAANYNDVTKVLIINCGIILE